MSITDDQQARLAGGVLGQRKSHEQIRIEYEQKVAKWQRESFPQDPVLLHELQVTKVDGTLHVIYALPNDDLLNPATSQKPVYFDCIQGDAVVEKAFLGCTVIITKVVFCSIDDIRASTLMVHDRDMNAVRASKVLLGLPGVKLGA